MYERPRLGALLASVVVLPGALLAGCASNQPTLEPVAAVELERFMGDWYVIASIPTPFEKDAYNAVETYERGEGNRIDTTFRFNKGGFDGPVKTMTPVGFVTDDPSNAIWGMQFVWPIKADYRIAYLDDAYSQTIIARDKRDYVWIMAREPVIDNTDYAALVKRVGGMGYDTSELARVPQQPLDARS